MPSARDPVAEAADELYGLPPGGFVAARRARADAARRAGDRSGATSINGLRKPTLAAWALNQLARRRPAELRGYLDLADALRTAQRELQGRRLRDLSEQRHHIVAALTREATGIAADAGAALGAAHQREITQTLHAALADEDVSGQLAAGRLTAAGTATTAFPGADLADSADQPDAEPPAGTTPAKKRRTTEDRRARAEAERLLAEAADATRAAEADLATAADRLHDAERHLADRTDQVADLTARLDRARRDQRQADKRTGRARQDRDAADHRLRQARRQNDDVRKRLERLGP